VEEKAAKKIRSLLKVIKQQKKNEETPADQEGESTESVEKRAQLKREGSGDLVQRKIARRRGKGIEKGKGGSKKSPGVQFHEIV